MPNSLALRAALCAVLDGDLSPETVAAALEDVRCARVLACTPDLPPWATALAAAYSDVNSLIPPDAAADANASAAMLATLRCLPEGSANWMLGELAKALPAGSFAEHAATLVEWARKGRSNAEYAAALIGPSPTAAGLITDARPASFAIRRWGAYASTPTGWIDAVDKAEVQRLVTLLERDSAILALALPFLPDPTQFLDRLVSDRMLAPALDVCLDAPPQAQMDALIDAILTRTGDPGEEFSIYSLTRLALRRADVVPSLVRRLMRSPDEAGSVCAAVRWEALPDPARAVIRASADRSDVCRAILTARGEQEWTEERGFFSAYAFFAALDVNVWNRLAPDQRAAWLRYTFGESALRVACRTLGPRVEALLPVTTYELEGAAAGLREHGLPPKSIRAALLPVACRDMGRELLFALLPHLERRVGDPLVFAQVATGIALASPLDRDNHRPAPRPSLAEAIDALDLLRADALHVSVLRLADPAAPLSATARALLRAAIPPDLLNSQAHASIDALDDALLLLLAAALHARRWKSDEATQSAADRVLAYATLVRPAIADLLASETRDVVADAEMAILTRLAKTEADIPGLIYSLAILGSRAPRDTLALLMALDRLKDDPDDAQARQMLDVQQGRLRWIADMLAPNLQKIVADASETPSAARNPARRLR